MSYLDDFEHSFMQHTLQIVRQYQGEYDATLLINCLLGLLVVPKEKFLEAVPEEPLSKLKKWGIDPKSIECTGRSHDGNLRPDTLRGLVINLRHAVAHCLLEPVSENNEVHSFRFSNGSGMRAVIKLKQLRVFVERLAEYLDQH